MTRFLCGSVLVLSMGLVTGCGSDEPQVVEQTDEITMEEQIKLDEQYEQEMYEEGPEGDE